MASVDIDDSLYSRQRYMLGDKAMKKMAGSNVLLVGLGGLGVEIAKNIILAGVKSITLQDSSSCRYLDLGTQFYLTEDDVKQGKNRVLASCNKLAELNPYVSVKTSTEILNMDTDLIYLQEFQVVILTETSLDLQIKVNHFCRQQGTPIKFLSADVYGVFCWTFCDFGNKFEVIDNNGEEPKDEFIGEITKSNPGVVKTFGHSLHKLESGDYVTFKEVTGMTCLNGETYKINVVDPKSFSICDTTGPEFGTYQNGGFFTQVKVPQTMDFESLEVQLQKPEIQMPDLSKFDAPMNIHVGMMTVHKYKEQHGRLPNIWCENDASAFLQLASTIKDLIQPKVEALDETLLKRLAFTSNGCFAPLCAFLGGVVAQEALKAVTGKYSPLKQWLHLDACEVLAGLDDQDKNTFQPKDNRYDALRICLGQNMCDQLQNVKLFMVGCGAIGCEMLKNYALLGIGCHPSGQITITDNDLIEKSNLNRQFLFRPEHIRKHKSTTAAQSAKDINPNLCIQPHQFKVGPDTEKNIYTDDFFAQQDIVVNALDNLTARLYVDGRCVTNQKALLESGTMGPKGHIQVIVPHLTESYGTKRDPVDNDVPYCTLKSFPAIIEHCIQWAREKFESAFVQKPQHFTKFCSENKSMEEVVQRIEAGDNLSGVVQVSKMSSGRPLTWSDCVAFGRAKFEKYFNHKARKLLHTFPLDSKLSDGRLFWQTPRRPPTPLEFDPTNEIHLSFVRASARLVADVCGVKWVQEDLTSQSLVNLLQRAKVPPFRPSSKQIVTDETVKKEGTEPEVTGDELTDCAGMLKTALQKSASVFKPMTSLIFEKDDDTNGHIDYITAASNLRAAMYNMEPADRLKTKRIAGRIVPAIATTTAAVAGLASIELVKVVRQMTLEQYKNTFLNLALPVFVLSEPGAVEKEVMSNGVSFTLWDKWEIHGNKNLTIAQFLAAVKEKYKVEPSMVVQGMKSIYLPLIPGHKKRLTQPINKFLKQTPGQKYTDLVLCFEPPQDDMEDESGPPVRYYFE